MVPVYNYLVPSVQYYNSTTAAVNLLLHTIGMMLGSRSTEVFTAINTLKCVLSSHQTVLLHTVRASGHPVSVLIIHPR